MPAGVLRPYAPCRTAPLQAARRSCFAPSLPANIGLGGQVRFVAKLHPAIHGMATAIAWANSSRQKTGANARGCPPVIRNPRRRRRHPNPLPTPDGQGQSAQTPAKPPTWKNTTCLEKLPLLGKENRIRISHNIPNSRSFELGAIRNISTRPIRNYPSHNTVSMSKTRSPQTSSAFPGTTGAAAQDATSTMGARARPKSRTGRVGIHRGWP